MRLGAVLARWAATGLTAPIEAYRRFISPALPPRCRFYPTCSAYAIEAIRTRGPVTGLGLAVWRLLRCHPFHPGGYEPVPARPDRSATHPTDSGVPRWTST